MQDEYSPLPSKALSPFSPSKAGSTIPIEPS